MKRLLVSAIVVFILATRFCHLGLKPFHHDESLFSVYSYLLRTTGDYDFQPILHGPFLQDIQALMFRVIGDSDVVSRLWSALAGTLLIVFVWRLRYRLGDRATLLAVALAAASPTLMYYSRFNRNDIPFTMAAMAFVFCMARFTHSGILRYWRLGILAAAWMVCIEETYVIFLFAATTYVILVGLIDIAARLPFSFREWVRRVAGAHKHYWMWFSAATAAGLFAGLFLIVFFHTTYFKHMEHWDGPIEAIRYWIGQHKEQRIFGEYHYHIPILITYEFLPLTMFLWGIARTLRRAPWLGGWIAWVWAAWSAVLLIALLPQKFAGGFSSFTHMTRGWHLWLAVQVLVLCSAAGAVLIIERRRLAGFFVWWTMGSFLAYAYAGEKVPWLAIHIVFPMIVAASMLWSAAGCHPTVRSASCPTQLSTLQKCIRPTLFTFGLLATVFVSLRLCFINYANPAERHVYTHTTNDYKAMLHDISDIVQRTNSGSIEQFPLIVAGDSSWPGQWYFRRWTLMRAAPLTPQSPIIIVDEFLDPLHRDVSALKKYPWLLDSHVVRRVPFREWWHQDTLLPHVARLLDIWKALVPKQYRDGLVTDNYGRAVGWIGDRAKLPNLTIDDEIRASKMAWRDVFDYIIFRRDFDPYRFYFPTRSHMSVLLCVRKDLYRQWSHLGGRHEDSLSRFVRKGITAK